MKKSGIIGILCILFLAGCARNEELREDIDALKRRIVSLETQTRDMNKNIESVSELIKTGIFIVRAEEQNNVCTLTLSNGKTVNLYMKTDNSLLCPLIGIDDEGYWTVCYDKATGFQRLTVDGNPVKAKGEDGKTPEFSVDGEGYWQIRYSAQESFTPVYREGTQEKVSATGTASGSSATNDGFFQTVEITANELRLVLKGGDGTPIRIPIVSDFELSFEETVRNTMQEFSAGETKTYALTMRGVTDIMISAPDGWKASVDNATLSVTAPAASRASTRATADNTNEIALLATSGRFAIIAKIRVKLIETVQVRDNKALFEAGELKIGAETLDKATYTDVKTLDGTGEKNLSTLLNAMTPTVIFLSGTEEFNIGSMATINTKIAIVGQSVTEKSPTVTFSESAYLSLKSGKLLLKNVNIKARATNYIFNSPTSGDASFEQLTFDDCRISNITKAMYYISNTSVGIKNIHFTRSVFEFVNTTNIAFFNISNTQKPSVFQTFTLENNVIYHKTSVAPIQLFNWNTGTTTTDTNTMTVKVKNNSFINVKGTNVFVKAYKANIEYTDNIFCITTDNTQTSYLYEVKESTSTAAATGNIVFDAKVNWNFAANASTIKPDNNVMEKVGESPFTATNFDEGIFEKSAAYADKGANLGR